MVMRNVPVGIRAGLRVWGRSTNRWMKPHSACARFLANHNPHFTAAAASGHSLALIYSFVRAITTVSAIVFLVRRTPAWQPPTFLTALKTANRRSHRLWFDSDRGDAGDYFPFDWLIGEARISRSKAKNQAYGAHYESEKFC